MQRFKHFVSRHLAGTRAYVPLRTLYQTIFNRELIRIGIARQNFYSQFVRPGSTVFDVGANVGEYSHMFLRLGARVIAVEPNPACCRRVRALGYKRNLTVRCEAVGEKQGTVSLFVGDYSGISTVSEDWMQRASQNDSGFQWNSSIQTKMNTLDQIRQEHKVTPDFIKIDVEGFEAGVLRGMSFRPSALCFEFHAFAPEALRECLDLPIFEGGCVFNVAMADTWELVWPVWRDKTAVLEYTSNLASEAFGDVYVRFEQAA